MHSQSNLILNMKKKNEDSEDLSRVFQLEIFDGEENYIDFKQRILEKEGISLQNESMLDRENNRKKELKELKASFD